MKTSAMPLVSLTRQPSALRTVGLYALGLALCLVLMICVLRLWQMSWPIPLNYEGRDLMTRDAAPLTIGCGDAMFYYGLVKRIQDSGWMLHSNYLGMPFGSDLHDFPVTLDLVHLLILKFTAIFTPSFGVTVNIFYLLTYPLTMLCGLFVLRQLKLSFPAAITGALLYTFLPYHLMRGQTHLFLAAYYLVPLDILVAWWIWNQEQLFRPRITHKGRGAILIMVLTGAGGVYYAFFTLLLLGATTAIVFWRQKSWRTLVAPLILGSLLGATTVGTLAPSLIYRWQHGANSAAVIRQSGETEMYGLKIIQLLLPIRQHRIPMLAKMADGYAMGAPLVTENYMASLGMIGSAGFLMLLGWILGIRFRNSRTELWTMLATLALVCVLYGTIGGFSSIFSFSVANLIRSVNRISIFIAFFAIAAAMLLLEEMRVLRAFQANHRLWVGVVVLAACFGVWDQTSEVFVPLYHESAESFNSDAQFMRKIEQSAGRDAMIFQLPWISFPGGLPVGDYQLFRGYLHSTTLCWSYGGVRGRETDRWGEKNNFAHARTRDLITVVRQAGFHGIYLDRRLYRDPSVENALRTRVAPNPIESANKRLVFFRLR